MRVDPYKFGAYVERLTHEGAATRVAVAQGPRAVVEAYRGDVFHNIPFLTGSLAPPPVAVLLADGHLVGSVLSAATLDEAEVVDQTLMAAPYRLAPPAPRVLLLGETGGYNVWLAARRQASSIHVVHPDENVFALMKGALWKHGGSVLDLPGVHKVTAEPRHFVEHTTEGFDLIQIVTLESSAAGTSGIGGLAQDYLVTVEGIGACLAALTSDGLLTVTRGIQTPPRDNLKLLATFVAALRGRGISRPERHVVIVRDYLAVCTIAKPSPWTPRQIEQVRRLCRERELTPVWFPGIETAELNQPDELDGPPDGAGDWYYHAATRLFADDAERWINQWPFNIRPPTDDRPFFLDFCKWQSLGELKATFGDLWLTRTELAFLFVLAAIVMVGAVGTVLTLVPLLFLRSLRGGRSTALSGSVKPSGTLATVGYFAAIGLGYLLLEMTVLSRLTHWIGDPVSAAALTISAFLFLSGLGSLTAQRVGGDRTRLIRLVVVALVIVGALELILLSRLAGSVGALAPLARFGVALLTIAPMAYLMGFLMPSALARLDRAGGELIPWAWGVNGFASVLAAPLATAIGMTWGFHVVGGLGLILYIVPALLFSKLPGQPSDI